MRKTKSSLFLVSWLSLFAGYLLYVDSTKPQELLAGLVASAGTALLFLYLQLKREEQFRPLAKWTAPAWRLPWAILWETWLIFKTLAKKRGGTSARGRFIRYPYSKKENSRSAALRAIITYGVCVSPNSYMIDIDLEKREFIVRQLAGRRISASDKAFLDLE